MHVLLLQPLVVVLSGRRHGRVEMTRAIRTAV
jgi:hypothetical protein